MNASNEKKQSAEKRVLREYKIAPNTRRQGKIVLTASDHNQKYTAAILQVTASNHKSNLCERHPEDGAVAGPIAACGCGCAWPYVYMYLHRRGWALGTMW